MESRPPKKPYQVHSLERGLDIMEILGKGPPEKTLTEISQLAHFNLTTTHRIISALLARGYVRRNPSNSKFRLGFELFELGQSVIKNLNLRDEALPILKGLADKTGNTAYLSIMDNDEALCIERIEGFHQIKILALFAGGRIPLHMGAGPKALLASLPEEEIDRIIETKGLPGRTKYTITNPRTLKEELKKIRKQGFCFSSEDFTENAASVGCSIRNWKGEVAAAISITGLVNYFRGEELARNIQAIKESAEEFSRRLNASKPTTM